ncbi:DinB family protein [Neolewinella lacunae]|uniref:DinB family protein n=1 Tax=Neolewinella lacunae TaxID=1517758 RepID=A0A923PLD8_9BACT|nr:DinB family protein [Neolewinella lacunae]MBC6992632.1 DinB family protein [Neolewinella lacunae]MDN3633511.1 DinB family protein [Neolewinella lacunae]
MNEQRQMTLAMLRATRNNILGIYNSYDYDHLNSIPAGLSNNLLWNAGHVMVTLDLLTYGLAGLPLPSDPGLVARYRKGSRPDGQEPESDYGLIGESLLHRVDRLEEDLQSLDFSNFKVYTTSFGVTLHNIDEALTFNNMHEAMHLGTMLALRKLL